MEKKSRVKYTKPRNSMISKETTRDRHLMWNNFYSNNNFGIWIECSACKKWRKNFEYNESDQVPKNWDCSMGTLDNGEKGTCDHPEEDTNEEYLEYSPGSIVWAKLEGYPWWPAMVDEDPDIEEYFYREKNSLFYNVTFLDEYVTRAWIKNCFILPISRRPRRSILSRSYNVRKYERLIVKAEERAQTAVNLTIKERLERFSFVHLHKGKWPLAANFEEEEENELDITDIVLKEVDELESLIESDTDGENFEYERFSGDCSSTNMLEKDHKPEKCATKSTAYKDVAELTSTESLSKSPSSELVSGINIQKSKALAEMVDNITKYGDAHPPIENKFKAVKRSKTAAFSKKKIKGETKSNKIENNAEKCNAGNNGTIEVLDYDSSSLKSNVNNIISGNKCSDNVHMDLQKGHKFTKMDKDVNDSASLSIDGDTSMNADSLSAETNVTNSSANVKTEEVTHARKSSEVKVIVDQVHTEHSSKIKSSEGEDFVMKNDNIFNKNNNFQKKDVKENVMLKKNKLSKKVKLQNESIFSSENSTQFAQELKNIDDAISEVINNYDVSKDSKDNAEEKKTCGVIKPITKNKTPKSNKETKVKSPVRDEKIIVSSTESSNETEVGIHNNKTQSSADQKSRKFESSKNNNSKLKPVFKSFKLPIKDVSTSTSNASKKLKQDKKNLEVENNKLENSQPINLKTIKSKSLRSGTKGGKIQTKIKNFKIISKDEKPVIKTKLTDSVDNDKIPLHSGGKIKNCKVVISRGENLNSGNSEAEKSSSGKTKINISDSHKNIKDIDSTDIEDAKLTDTAASSNELTSKKPIDDNSDDCFFYVSLSDEEFEKD